MFYLIKSLLPNIVNRIQLCISELIGEDVTIKVKRKYRLKPEESPVKLCKEDNIVVIHTNIKTSMKNDKIYQGLITLSIDSAKNLSKLLLSMVDIDLSEESAFDALCEFGNIVFGAFTSEISKKYHLRIDYSIPQVIVELCPAIISSLVAEIGAYEDFIDVYELKLITNNGLADIEVLMFKGGIMC